jgi:hypothetical protein
MALMANYKESKVPSQDEDVIGYSYDDSSSFGTSDDAMMPKR